MQREQTWDELARFLKNWTYVDGMYRPELIRDDESNYAILYIYLKNPNSYIGEPGHRVPRHTRHEQVVPVATYNYESWRRWVFEFVKSIAVHEVCEWFMDNGERIFAPHHGNGEDPYVEWYTRTDRAAQVVLAPGQSIEA